MQEAERNANSNINLMSTAEGALGTLDSILIRMRALAIQASNGSLDDTDRAALNVEYQQLKSEVDRIALITNYAGVNLLDGTFSSNGLKFHIGINNNANEDFYYVNLASMTAADLGIDATALTSTASSQAALGILDNAITSKDTERSRIGSYVERLQNTISALQVAQENATKSESDIRDADIAAEMSNFVRSQILMQTGVAMLTQANSVPQIIAQLVG
jgi:flagellin